MVIDNGVVICVAIELLKSNNNKNNKAMSKQKEIFVFKFSLFLVMYRARYVSGSYNQTSIKWPSVKRSPASIIDDHN